MLVRRSKRLPDGGGAPDQLVRDLGLRFQHAAKRARDCGRIRRSPVAEEWWREEVYAELTPAEVPEGPVANVVARAVPQMLRLSLAYALMDSESVIGVEHLAAALSLWRYVVASASYVFGGSTSNADLDRLARAVTDAGPAGLTREEIRSDVFGRHRNAAQLDALLGQLVVLGFEQVVVPRADGRAGRHRTIYRLPQTGTQS